MPGDLVLDKGSAFFHNAPLMGEVDPRGADANRRSVLLQTDAFHTFRLIRNAKGIFHNHKKPHPKAY